MPSHFRWLWYLVGLAGMALTVVGVLAILGSAADLGIVVPVVVGGAIVIGYGIVRFRRSIDAALAAAPSRRAGSTVSPTAAPTATDAGATTRGGTAAAEPVSSSTVPPSPVEPERTAKKPASGPPRTSRR